MFKQDLSYEENEGKYAQLKEEILGDSSDEGSSGDSESEDDDENKETLIVDKTETNLVALRRTIYLTIQSALTADDAAHKLLKMELKPGQEVEMCHMILDCCAQQRSYNAFYGSLAQVNACYIALNLLPISICQGI